MKLTRNITVALAFIPLVFAFLLAYSLASIFDGFHRWRTWKLHLGLILILSLLTGCASFVSEQVAPDGTRTTIRAITFFDGRSELAKLRTTQTEKTQGVSLGALNQETSGTNATQLIEVVVRAAVAAAIGIK